MLTTRREFLGSAGSLAGLVFVGCEMLAVPHAHAQPRRRETMVAGKRAKVIDIHAHCAVPEAERAASDYRYKGEVIRALDIKVE